MSRYIHITLGVLISILVIVVISLSVSLDNVRTELADCRSKSAVQSAIYSQQVERMRLAIADLEQKKSQIVTKYIPVTSDKLDTCEKQLNEILKIQELFYAR